MPAVSWAVTGERRQILMMRPHLLTTSPTTRPLLLLLLLLITAVSSSEVSGQSDITGHDVISSLSDLDGELPRTESNRVSLEMTRALRNTTRDAGGSLKLRCEAEGDPAVTEFRWFKHHAPVITERGRVRIKSNYEESPQWSQLRINVLETLDTAFYRCEASNGVDKVSSDAIVRVNLGTFGTLPRNFPPAEPNFPSGPTDIEFEGGRSPHMEEEEAGGSGQAD